MVTKKLYIIFAFFLLAAGAIIWRLYCLQIEKGGYYEALALGQYVSFEETISQRGSIFLSNSQTPLAQLKKRHLAYIFPKQIPDSQLEEQTEILAELLAIDKEELIDIIRQQEVFKKELTEKQAEEISKAKLEAVYLDKTLIRFYPQNNLASNLIGFVNEEGEGQYGIEGYYDELLSEKGGSLTLSLDYNIQYFAEKLLEQASQDFQIESGQIIVQEPSTGRILAMAEWPSFNPNSFSQEQDFDIFKNASSQKLFEPGSVFKPITMAAALEENVVGPETVYTDTGCVEIGGPPEICNFEKRIWGKQTMTDVLEESINTGAVFAQEKTGYSRFLDYLEDFGFFEKTNIDLQAENFSKNQLLRRGYHRDLAAASFGQGIETTPIQIVRAFSAIANGGKLIKPTIVDKIIQEDGKETITEPEVQGKVISESASAKLSSMLVSVVEQGSGRQAKIPNYYIAGKTGTAQVPRPSGGYYENITIQSFAGYFPALNPQFLIFVKLDNPRDVKTAAYSAAPIFRQLALRIISLYQLPPDH